MCPATRTTERARPGGTEIPAPEASQASSGTAAVVPPLRSATVRPADSSQRQ